MNYYIDESGNTGDISLSNPVLSFGGQPIFSLACIGIDDLSAFETFVTNLRAKHKILSAELKAKKIYDDKPQFIIGIIKYIQSNNLPFFIEVVDKKYQICVHIVNHIIFPPYYSPPDDEKSLYYKNLVTDLLYDHLPDSLITNYIAICKEPDNTKLIAYFNEFIEYLSQGGHTELVDLLPAVVESLDDFQVIKDENGEGENTYKRFFPLPDVNKKGKLV